MKFTGVYAAYYQDVCKHWDKLIAKCMKLEKIKPELNNLFSDKIKRFNKTVDSFNGTSFVDDRKIRVNGVTKHLNGSSETILQIQCIFTLKNIYCEVAERYYALTDYSDITSWKDYDALFKEVEKEYVFIQETLKLYIAELKSIKANTLGAINAAADLQKTFEHTKKICSEQSAVSRSRSLPEFKRFSTVAARGCLEWFKKANGIILYQPFYL